MNKIDTEYQSLSEIDSEIVRFYSEDVRTGVVDYIISEVPIEGTDDVTEVIEPITEEYTVIVLNQPDVATYEYVESRRGRRFPEDVVKSFIPAAIEWEDFSINHDGYLAWLDEVAVWEDEQPMVQDGVDAEGEPVMVLVPQPVRPVVTLEARREVYEQVTDTSALVTRTTLSDVFNEVIDDTLFTVTKVYEATPFTDSENAARDLENARNYLLLTDWMSHREMDNGVGVPESIKQKRSEARVILNNTFIEPLDDF